MPTKVDEALKKAERGPEIARLALPTAVPKLIAWLGLFTEDEPAATIRYYSGDLIIEGPVGGAEEPVEA